jgi:tetratricopeptide (TPR) repeat protein
MNSKEEVDRQLKQVQKSLRLTESDTGLIGAMPAASRLHSKTDKNHLKMYEQVFGRMLAEAMERQSPMRESDRHELQALQQVLRLADEDVTDIENRLTAQLSAETVLPTENNSSATNLPFSNLNSNANPSVHPSVKIPSVELPPTEIPSTELPPTEISSTELPVPAATGEVNPAPNLTGVKGQMMKRKVEIEAGNVGNSSPIDQTTLQKNISPITDPSDAGAAKSTVKSDQPDANQSDAKSPESVPPDSSAAPVSQDAIHSVEAGKPVATTIKRDRRPLWITLGLVLPLLGVIGGVLFALRSNQGSNASPADAKAAEQLVELGTQKNQQRQYAAAIQDFDQAIRLNGKNVAAHHNRGFANHRLGRLNAAIDDYNRAITLNPNFAEAYSNRSHARFDQGQYDPAEKDANQAIKLNPQQVGAYLNLGNALFALKNLDGALQNFGKTIQMSSSGSVTAKAHNNRGNIFASKNQLDEAIRDYTQAIELDGAYADAFHNRGLAFERKGNSQGAINDFRKAAELYKAGGNLDRANSSTQRADQLQRNNAPARSTQSI